jgi:hypothetical protein
MQYRFLGILSLVALTVAVGTGCGRTTIVDNGEMKVKGNVGSGQYEYTNKETGETANVNIQKIPDNFPKDVPLLDNTTIVMTSVAPESASLVVKTSKSAAEVIDWYKEALAKEKWTINSQYSMPNVQVFDAKNASGAMLSILIGTDETPGTKEPTTITIARTEISAAQPQE